MKSILLKIDDELFEELENLSKKAKVSKSLFIRKAISDSIATLKRNQLAKELSTEIVVINELRLDSILIEEFETASLSDFPPR